MGQMASNLGNSNVTNPQQAQWGDLDQSEKGARLLAGTTGGLAKGFQNYQNQNQAMRQGGGGAMIQAPAAQPVDPAYFMPRKNNLSFYGDGGQ
jgi:hypothetical protein